MQCVDFQEFQDILKKMRDFDDKIIYKLNTSIPTTVTFRSQIDPTQVCEGLYNEILSNYKKRETAISECIVVSSDKIKKLKEHKDELAVLKDLKSEQTKLRLLKSELNVEEIIRDKTLKSFYERCHFFYKPNNLPI